MAMGHAMHGVSLNHLRREKRRQGGEDSEG